MSVLQKNLSWVFITGNESYYFFIAAMAFGHVHGKTNEKIGLLKLERIQQSLEEIGLPYLQPGDELVRHSAFSWPMQENVKRRVG